eukprot:1144409-Pelagomonas_calceolata.AAC.10
MKHTAASLLQLLPVVLLLFSPKFAADATTKALEPKAATWEKGEGGLITSAVYDCGEQIEVGHAAEPENPHFPL